MDTIEKIIGILLIIVGVICIVVTTYNADLVVVILGIIAILVGLSNLE
jgi:uncharacterized membrane protein HdeD (DUF308 family)